MTRRASGFLFIAGLIAVTAQGPVSLQLFLPALPAIQTGFATDVGTAQLGLSAAMFAIAVATLFYGPLSDRWGRRPVMLVGIVLYIAGSAVCVFAPDIATLIAGRILQAGGGAVGIVLTRAMVRDVYGRERGASMLAYVMVAMVGLPMFAPIIGGVLVEASGWRAVFVFALAVGVIVLALAYIGLPETLSERMTSQSAFLLGVVRLVRSPIFLSFSLHSSFAMASFFAFLAAAPYLMVNALGRSPWEFGLYSVLPAAGFMFGNLITGRFSTRVGLERMVAAGSIVTFIGWATMALVLVTLPLSPEAMFLPATLGVFGSGISQPNAQAGVVSVAPQLAGTAASLSGFVQVMMAALFAQAVGALADGTTGPMIVGSLVAATATLVFGLAVHRLARAPGAGSTV